MEAGQFEQFVLADELMEIQDNSMRGYGASNSGQSVDHRDEISDSQLLQAIEDDPMLGAGPQLDQDDDER